MSQDAKAFTPGTLVQLSIYLRDRIVELDDPKASHAMLLGGVIANIIGNIPGDYWDKMMVIALQPCGEPGCNCHILMPEIMGALQLIRDDFSTYTRPEQN